MPILSTAYLGNIRYYARLLAAEPVVIDLGEHYRKQSYRNRCEILGPNGVIALTVPVYKTSGEKTAVRDVRIDPTKAWQHQHWHSIRSAYGNSPFFEHYAPRFEGFYKKRYGFLRDWNHDLQQAVLHALGVRPAISYSDSYTGILPEEGDFTPEPYHQVFSDRFPFIPNLSVLDLLFCEGPAAEAVIRRSGGLPGRETD